MQNVSTLNTPPRPLALDGLSSAELIQAVSDAVKAEAKRLDAQADVLRARVSEFEDIDFDDVRLRRQVSDAREGISVETVRDIWLEITRPDRERLEREMFVVMKSHSKSQSLRYFTITNARRNTVHLLADNAEVARYLAFSAGRITDKSHGNLRVYDTVSTEKLSYGVGIEKAIEAGWPGELEIMGDKVIHQAQRKVFG